MPLTLTEEKAPDGHERLLYAEDPASGLRAYICLHSTAYGPAAGGCRMWNYASKEEARTDVLRLAGGMTSKNAMAGIELGGGKSVIIGDARTDKSEDLFRSFGQAVHSLSGTYYTAEDVGISPEDMAIVAKETPYAVGLDGGPHGSGDPSPFTAEGVFQCLRAAREILSGSDNLKGQRVLVQGLGHVGMSLAQKLHAAGAHLIVSDINQAALDEARQKLDAEICPVEAVFETEFDIFAPCALGGVLTAETARKLTANLVCGAANNQLATPEVAEILRARNIQYLPDYVVNAGGIISVAGEIHKAGPGYREERLTGIASRIRDILADSLRTGKTTIQVADDMVESILTQALQVRKGAA
ncbi:Glu/Leu/Phe/Val family dehydrogenase [Roseibium sp.]|uniref:Glu/Leu/Phe/Val family dehydrogenase n=1 Tax=Roseibium sp. TaxID=1936156 RepID=UPI003BB1FAF2